MSFFYGMSDLMLGIVSGWIVCCVLFFLYVAWCAVETHLQIRSLEKYNAWYRGWCRTRIKEREKELSDRTVLEKYTSFFRWEGNLTVKDLPDWLSDVMEKYGASAEISKITEKHEIYGWVHGLTISTIQTTISVFPSDVILVDSMGSFGVVTKTDFDLLLLQNNIIESIEDRVEALK